MTNDQKCILEIKYMMYVLFVFCILSHGSVTLIDSVLLSHDVFLPLRQLLVRIFIHSKHREEVCICQVVLVSLRIESLWFLLQFFQSICSAEFFHQLSC